MIDFKDKKRVFIDQGDQDKLNQDGFVIVDFLSETEVKELLDLYDELHPDGVSGFYTSTFSKDVNYRDRVDREIQRVMLRRINELFQDYKIYCGSYIVKAPGEKSELILHQDMTLVDESIYTGMNIWIPLVDLTKENGAIEVLPKSHRLFKTYRGASIPDIYDGIEKSVRSLMQPCYLKAGQAIIFDQSIIHYSPPNLSDKVRPVINTFVTHKDASIKIYYWDRTSEKRQVEVFDQADDFMINFQNFGHDIFSRPSIGQSAGFVNYEFPKITTQLLIDTYGFVPPKDLTQAKTEKRGFFNRIFNRNKS